MQLNSTPQKTIVNTTARNGGKMWLGDIFGSAEETHSKVPQSFKIPYRKLAITKSGINLQCKVKRLSRASPKETVRRICRVVNLNLRRKTIGNVQVMPIMLVNPHIIISSRINDSEPACCAESPMKSGLEA